MLAAGEGHNRFIIKTLSNQVVDYGLRVRNLIIAHNGTTFGLLGEVPLRLFCRALPAWMVVRLTDGIDWSAGYDNAQRSDMGSSGGPGALLWMPRAEP